VNWIAWLAAMVVTDRLLACAGAVAVHRATRQAMRHRARQAVTEMAVTETGDERSAAWRRAYRDIEQIRKEARHRYPR
jgi:hypothetical protein